MTIRELYRLTWALLWIVALAGCFAKPKPTAEQPHAGKVLYVFNWSDYIDPEILDEFEAKTGARIVYDNYSSDAELEAKLLTGSSGYDVIFPSDRSMPVLLKKQVLAKLDKSLLSQYDVLDPRYLGAPFDPKNEYVVPYFTGTLAVAVNEEHVAATAQTGFEVLFDSKYRGHITMLDDPEHNVAATLLRLGRPLNSLDDMDLADVQKLLIEQKPLVQAYTSDDYKERLIRGETWVALGWSGDLLQAKRENDKIRVLVPPAGTMIWMDGMAITKDSKQKELAHAFIDFLLTPEIAVRNAEFVQYASPNLKAIPLLPETLRTDPTVYLPEDLLQRCNWMEDRGSGVQKIEAVWKAVRDH
ncbi:MAG: ABC transporter substrate-binding protein [Planctomycetaceae bacterium]